MAITATYLSSLSFTVPGDLGAEFAPGVRVLADCGADGLRLGTVTGATAANGATTVTLALDAGELTANLAGIWHGNDVPDSLIRATADYPGAVELATAAEALAGTDAARVPSVAALRQAYLSWQRDDAGRFPGLIPPAFNLFAPNLALPGTVAFSRASSAWRLGAAGLVVPAAINVPRFDYDADGNLLGLRLENAATRINTIAAAPVSPESVAVTAQAYTVSFFGAGSVVLSGAHAATVGGAGPLPARMRYTFTPAAGTLTLTPSGDVRHLQVEAGPFATTPILGEGSQVTRAADVTTVALSGIDFNTSEGSIYIDFITPPGLVGTTEYPVRLDDGTNSDHIRLMRDSNGFLHIRTVKGGATQDNLGLGAAADNTAMKIAFSWDASDIRAAVNGIFLSKQITGSKPTVTTLRIGLNSCDTTRHLAYFPRALTAAKLQAMTL